MAIDYLAEFAATLDAAPIDPRPDWTATVTRIIEQELGPRSCIPTKIAAEIARSPLRELSVSLCTALRDGNYSHGQKAIVDFLQQLRNTIRREREHGKLKPVSPSGEIDRNLPAFRVAQYRAIELDSLLALLQPGEQIIAVAVRGIQTSTRTIARGELVNVLKPPTQTNVISWTRQFPDDAALVELEEAAHRRAHPVPPSFDNYNHDLPRPMKME